MINQRLFLGFLVIGLFVIGMGIGIGANVPVVEVAVDGSATVANPPVADSVALLDTFKKQEDRLKPFGIELSKEGIMMLENSKDSSLTGSKLGLEVLPGDLILAKLPEGKGDLSFNASKVQDYCEQNKINVTLTTDGLKFSNGAIYSNGDITFPGEGKIVLTGEDASPARADLSNVAPADFTSLKNFEIKGDNSVVKDHLGNTYTDTNFKLDRVGDDGALKITATTPVSIDYSGKRFGTLNVGQMTMNPAKNTLMTGRRSMDTDDTVFVLQDNLVSDKTENVVTLSGKLDLFDQLDLYNEYTTDKNLPKVFFGLDDGSSIPMFAADISNGAVFFEDVNPLYSFFADVHDEGELSWILQDSDEMKFMANKNGLFVGPDRLSLETSKLEEILIDLDNRSEASPTLQINTELIRELYPSLTDTQINEVIDTYDWEQNYFDKLVSELEGDYLVDELVTTFVAPEEDFQSVVVNDDVAVAITPEVVTSESGLAEVSGSGEVGSAIPLSLSLNTLSEGDSQIKIADIVVSDFKGEEIQNLLVDFAIESGEFTEESRDDAIGRIAGTSFASKSIVTALNKKSSLTAYEQAFVSDLVNQGYLTGSHPNYQTTPQASNVPLIIWDGSLAGTGVDTWNHEVVHGVYYSAGDDYQKAVASWWDSLDDLNKQSLRSELNRKGYNVADEEVLHDEGSAYYIDENLAEGKSVRIGKYLFSTDVDGRLKLTLQLIVSLFNRFAILDISFILRTVP